MHCKKGFSHIFESNSSSFLLEELHSKIYKEPSSYITKRFYVQISAYDTPLESPDMLILFYKARLKILYSRGILTVV